jgi:hypothetical protein
LEAETTKREAFQNGAWGNEPLEAETTRKEVINIKQGKLKPKIKK